MKIKLKINTNKMKDQNFKKILIDQARPIRVRQYTNDECVYIEANLNR